jgi:ribonuclease P protein component
MIGLNFPKHYRLLTKSDYSRVFSSSKPIKSSNWLILIRKNELGFARLGLIIAKKKCKRAVDRNTLKRLTREIFRVNHALVPNVDVIVLLRGSYKKEKCKKSENSSFIKKELQEQWQKLINSYA